MELYQKSIDIILANQSEYGSFRAGPSFETYKYSWIRDGSFIAHALDAADESEHADAFFCWVDTVIRRGARKVEMIERKTADGERLEKSDFLNARFTLDGFEETEEGWGNFQLDGYGTWLWALAEHMQKTGRTEVPGAFRESVELSIRYIQSLWHYPNYDIWEENSDKIHTSTLACLYGGLNAIGRYLKDVQTGRLAARIRTYLLTNCVKNGTFVKYIGTDDVDASLLWLALPFGVVAVDDPIFKGTVNKIEQDLLHDGGLHRYRKDTYYGGGEWVLLSCWLGLYDAAVGRDDEAAHILGWVEHSADENGNLPEQVCEHMNDETKYDDWVRLWGAPASPLLWSHAMYILLKKEMTK